MGSITESVGSGRTNVRRYSSIQARLQRWNHGNTTAELPTHLQKIRTHGTRTPALDLAQQAQLAACNYLGYSPRDLPNSLFQQQALPSDGTRPVELHMHHFHHHYIASPTSPFSQTSSQCYEGPAAENTGAPATELTIRVGSPVPANPISTTKAVYQAPSTTVYPALGLRGSSIGSQFISTLPGRVNNASQSLLNGTSLGDVEAAHRYMQNILWLKNQIDHGEERRGETPVGTETRILGRKSGSPHAGIHPVTSVRRPIRRTRKMLWSRDRDDTQESMSEGEHTCQRRSKSRPTSDSALLLEKCEKIRAIRNNNSPCNSLSEDNSVTDDSARSESLPPVNSRKSPNVCMTMRTTKMVENGGMPSRIETPDLKLCKSQGTARSAGCFVCPAWPLPRRQDSKLRRERTSYDDTASSLENESICSSGKVSVHTSTLTYTSSGTDSDTEQKERSPPGRPAKKSCGPRLAHWESNERKPRKIAYRPNTRLETTMQPMCVFEMDSEAKTDEKDLEDIQSQVPDRSSSIREIPVEEKERGDANRSRVEVLGSQTRLQTEVKHPNRTLAGAHTQKAWNSYLGPNRGLQRVSVEHDTNGTDEQNLDQPHPCISPRTIENKTGDQNRLREALEAAWNTNLGTKRALGDDCVKASSGHICADLHNTGCHGELKENTAFSFSGEGEVYSCEETWKAGSGMKKGCEEDCRKKIYADPIFQNIYRDHENLKALVAREESLQRELKDQTVARVGAEEKARLAAEQKAHLYEASAKAAEEGLRVLLNERAVFHCKFQEELEKGATDRLRLQELLHLEKLKLEETESELREVRRSFQNSLAVGTRQLPSKNSIQDPTRLDGLSAHAVAPHGLGGGHDDARLQLMAESEKRIAAESKASYFEESAKAAEDRLHSLLEERNWFYLKFKEELEQNNTDMKKLQQLMELEKSNDGHAESPQKRKQDMRSPVGSGFSLKNLDVISQVDSAKASMFLKQIVSYSRVTSRLIVKVSWPNEFEAARKDGQGGPHGGMHYRASFHSRDEEIVPEDKDRHRLKRSLEYEETPEERVRSYHKTQAEMSDYTQAEEEVEEDQKSVSSIDIYENRDVRYVKASHETTSMKNEKKRPLSPINGSRVRQWKSPDGPFSVKVERCNGRAGENTTVLDISPGGGELDSVDLHFGEIRESPNGCVLAAEDSFDLEENAFDSKTLRGFTLENCAEKRNINGGQPMFLPSKWKKETKAELRKMIQEQERTWKMAEDAVEELGRRLELLERYKMEIQDTLGRRRVMGNMDCFFKRLKENSEEFPRGFNSLYKSSIYDEEKSLYNCPILKGAGAKCTVPCQHVCTSPTRPNNSKDSEIQKLKAELAQLRCELQQRDSKRSDSPKLKNDFQLAPRSPRSPRIPTPTTPVSVSNWSTHISSGFKAPVNEEDTPLLNHISQGSLTMQEVIAEDMMPELLDHSFEEMKTITIQATPNGSEEHSNGKVDRFQHKDHFSPQKRDLDMDDRGWVPTPDEEFQEKMLSPMFSGNSNFRTEKLDCKERTRPGEDVILSVDLNSEEALQVLKTAIRKLSRIFWEQEEKLKMFKQRDKEDEDKTSQVETEESRDLYLGMLKEMSQQLGQLCHDLHAHSRFREAPHKEKGTVGKADPMEKLMDKFQHMEVMDPPVSDVEVAQVEHKNGTLFSTNERELGLERIIKGVDDQPQSGMSESANLRAALKSAGNKIEEQMSTNQLLKEKLESGSQYLSKLRAEHAQEVARKDESINHVQQLNFDLTHDMTQTETSLAEIKSRYKSLVSHLEQQFEEARKEAISLKDTVSILKEEIVGKENFVSTLEAEANEHVLQIQELRSQIQAIQNEIDVNLREKVELHNSLEALRREVDQQQHRVTELVSINEELIIFSQSKEDEIRELTKILKGLQQCVNERSAEAAKLSAEALAFSQEVVETRKEGETYRLRCTVLKSKMEEIEHELLAREASMERLTQHLGKTIEGQDFILEEKEQLLLSLNRAQYKEHRLDDQVRQSKTIIQDLEEKLSSMDAEINEARLEMAEMKSKGMEALLMEKQAGEMRNRVHELEEEIMEKEGQISILKTSYPGEYVSTF